MTDKKMNLDFYARVHTDVDSVKTMIGNLKTELNGLKLPAGATKNFEKSFERLEEQIREFESLASGVNSLADTKKAQAAWDKIAKSITSLGFSLKELNSINSQIFPKEVIENIKKANRALEDYQNKLKEIKDTENYKTKKTQISEAEGEVARTRKRYNTAKTDLANKRDEVTGLEKAWASHAEEYDKQIEKINKLSEEYQNLSDTLAKMRTDKATLESLGVIDSRGKVSSEYKKDISAKESELAELEDEKKVREKIQSKQLEFEEKINKAQKRLKTATKNKSQSRDQEKKAKWTKEEAEAQKELNAAQNEAKDFIASMEARKESLREEIQLMKERIALAEQLTKSQINEQNKKVSDKKKELEREEDSESFKADKKLKKSLDTASSELKTLEAVSQSAKTALDTAEKAVEDLNEDLDKKEADGAKKEWQNVINTLKQFTDISLDETKGDIEEVKKILEKYTTDEIKKTPEILERLRQAVSDVDKPIRNVADGANDTAEGFREMDRAAHDMENLKNQVLDFFSITNTIQIFKNAIRDAFDTVKELDAAMTETAVVTDFSVGDMWDKLPEYSEEATKLGASIKGLYEATTLYYQQGLQTEEAMGVGIETMKMARIANMDAAQATEAMTAALRGFNMEINETSAIRINDVYSELAAVTAADTSQIATAMGKTASIASSANMEFETTAALLAQIIETTQEAPETAGTAMKTIIARFTEVKQLFSQGLLTGEDSEGETIEINKIDAALKTVGISLKDFLTGAKGIDDIFLELASKWNTLDLATQRYIATTAAGSRQQSRFLAMMGNYDRTMELVNAATNSAGASQKQFGKTLDSLDAKLQKLKNAWDTFTMGLANSELIKIGVDILTGLLEVANNLTEAFDGIGGSVAKIGLVIASLKAGKGIFNLFTGKAYSEGVEVGANFASGIVASLSGIKIEAAKNNLEANMTGILAKTNQLSTGLMGLGLGFKFVAQQIENTPYAEYADEISGIGTAIMVVSGAMKILTPVAAAANLTLKELSLTLLANPYTWAAAAILALGAALVYISQQNPDKVLERTRKYAKEAGQAAEEATQAYNDLKTSLDNLNGSEQVLDGLVAGTREWKEAVLELNNEVLNLLDTYPELDELVNVRDGHLTIDYESDRGQEILKQIHTKAVTSQIAAIAADATVLEAEKRSYYYDNIYGLDYFGGIQEGAIEELAKYVSGEGLDTFSKDQTSAKIIEWLNKNEDLSKFANDQMVISQLTNGIEELYRYGEYLAQTEQRSRGLDAQARGTVISGMDTEQYETRVISLLGQLQIPIQAYADNWEDNNEITKTNYQEMGKAYIESLMGPGATAKYKAITNEVVVTSQDGTEQKKIGFDAFKSEVAYYEATKQAATELNQAAEAISNMNEEQTGLLSKIISSEGQLMDSQFLKEVELSGGIQDYISKNFGADLAANFEEIFEISFETLESNLSMANERIAKERVNLAKKMSKYSTDPYYKNTSNNLDVINALEFGNWGSKLGEETQRIFNEVINSLELTGDTDLITSGLDMLRAVAIEGTKEQVQELSTLINKINWSNPIDAAYQLNQKLKEGTELTKGFANNLLQSNSKFLTSASQMSSFFKSDIYDEVSSELDKILETQDQITDSDIRKLSSEYSVLNKLMKNASVTGSGLAVILTSIKKGELSFDAVTDAVIAAVGQMDTLGEATNQVLEKLKELELGEDLGEVQDKYGEFAEKVNEFQTEGQYGNEQYENILNYMFGADWDAGYEDDLIGRMQNLSKIVSSLGGDMFYAWDNASKGLDIYGNKIESSAIQKLSDLGIVLDSVDGKVVFEIPDDMEFDTITQLLSETFGASKEMWDDLMVYFESRDPNFRRSWTEADYGNIGKGIAESESTKVGEKKIVSEKEIEDAAKFWAQKSSKTVEEVVQDIKQQLQEYSVDITVIPNLEGLSAEEISAALDEAFGGVGSYAAQFSTILGDTIQLDLYSLYESLLNLGISEEIAVQIANGAVQGADKVVSEFEGKTITFDVTTDDEDYVASMLGQIEEIKKEFEEEELTATTKLDYTKWTNSVDRARAYMDQVLGNINYEAIVTIKRNSQNSSSKNEKTQGISNGDIYMEHFAKGTKKSSTSGLALTGEEGPELVETQKGAYLVGTDGPQMAYINQGDRVYTADETKEIYQRRGKAIPAYKGGTMSSVSSSSKGNSEETEPWENSFDKLYNLIREIDEELRQRERIERRYEKLLENLDASADKILKVSYEELAQLESERALQEQLVQDRRTQISQYQAENADLNKYASVTQNERGEDILRINWDLIDSITDTDKGGRVEDYVSQLEEWFESLEEAEDALWEIEDAVADIRDRGKDEYFELEEAIKDALVQSYQDEIEKLDAINTSINDTNASLMDSIQKTLDKQRQERDNQRTEEDLAEKQRRLLYLQQDTSGANDLAILELQKEIAQGQEDYTDSLIDQKISELQEQNDEAARQREQQVSLLQAQLDHYIRFGEIWGEVYNLMDEGLDKDKGLVRGSRLEELLKTSAGFSGMSTIGQMEWLKETNSLINQALVYLELGRQLEDIGVKNQDIEVILPDGTTVKGTVDDKGNVTTKDGKTYSNVYQGADGRYYVGDTSTQNPPAQPEPPKEQQPTPAPEQKPAYPNNTEDNITGIAEAIWIHGQDTSGWGAGEVRKSRVDTKIGPGAGDKVQNKINQIASGKVATGKAKKSLSEYYYKKFKYGGLADFTGPAWLDGTKARPELVLNSKDTQNFIQLKDILASLMTRPNSSSENNGDITYDIDINVESIGSDYDVEQVANKVKSLINQDARYRNNNSVSLMR